MRTKLHLYNTLSRKKEVFKPIDPPNVGLYTCGPTVYGPGHLGHARTYIGFDILKRVLKFNGLKVKHVLNITDVHDDMIRRANERGVTISELAEEYIPQFYADLAALNIQPADVYPRVTEHIDEIVKMVQELIEKGYAYVEEDGSVYFQVSKFENYGELSGVRLDQAKVGTRVDTDKYEKEDSADFALWKARKPGEPAWDSPWGEGRPGWHIECSVMVKEHLGKTIDIHGGAVDLKFPHHENEIAQSGAANGVRFANFWVHAGLLEVEGKKMSKSLGNIYTLVDLHERGFTPLAFRYLCLTTHYRSQLNFTWGSLEAAQTALERLRNAIRSFGTRDAHSRPLRSSQARSGASRTFAYARSPSHFQKKFLEVINDDLDMPKALALVWELVKSDQPAAAKYETLLRWDEVLGLSLDKPFVPVKEVPHDKLPHGVLKLVERREELRRGGDFEAADEIRQQTEKMGFVINDTPEGPKVCEKQCSRE